MPHVAGLRGVVAEPSKLAEVIARPVDLAKGLAAGTLGRDANRAVYRYHQTFIGGGRPFTRKSFACAVRLSDPSEGLIRLHEETTPAGRGAALARIRANKAHTEPLLCGIRDTAAEVERLFRSVESGRPTLEITTADGTQHKLWRAANAELIGKLRNYFTPKKLHLLEGHDTYDAMLAYRDELANKNELSMYSSANYGLAYVVPLDDAGLVPAPRHRVISGLTVKSDEVLAAAKKHFIVDKLVGGAADVNKLYASLADSVAHQPAFIAVFAGEPDAWKLTLSPEVSAIAEGVNTDRALQKLDPIVTEHLFVARHLKGGESTSELDAKVALAALGQGASVALIQRALSVAEVAHVDELGQKLPAKSTAFHPQIAAGLVSLIIDPDEDLV